MSINNYKDSWNNRVTSAKTGAIAVDGSTDEATLVSNGEWTAAQLRAALDIQPSDTVLELGCGVARIGKQLAKDCAHWIGTDISENMIEQAKARTADLDNVSFKALTRNDLSAIEDASIDKLYSVAVLCHMDKEDLFNYMREVQRVLKPGGITYLETWNMDDTVGWKRWQYEADNWFISEHSERKDVARNQFCYPGEFALYAQKAGLQSLAFFHKSSWNQIIAGKDLDADTSAHWQQRLETDKDKIIYSDVFNRLFEYAVDVTYNAIHPSEMMTFIDGLGDLPEAKLYRTYLIGLWKNNTELWGDCDY